MQTTTQTRLRLSKEAESILQRYGDLHGTLKRKLYACVAAGGGNAMASKTDFCRTHVIPARLLNALACDVQGQMDGTRVLLKERRPGVSTVGRSPPASPSSKDHRPPCAILNVQICTSLK